MISPLDWGLGHATRCIPIIKWLLAHNYEVVVAASGSSLHLLKNEFPDLKFYSIRGYRIQYSNKKRFLPLKILLQIPKILLTIRNEHRWLRQLCNSKKFDAIISDNRFGFYHSQIPSIFISHQLLIFHKSKILRNLLQKINFRFINRFTCCAVPDSAVKPGFAGMLSHPEKLPAIPVFYLGPVSRFYTTHPQAVQKKYNVCFLLSGPEPQRSLFEQKVFEAAPHIAGKLLLLRAKPEVESTHSFSGNLEIFNHLSTDEIRDKIIQSEFVVSRAGYTTIMELAALRVKGILIPTPGQTEQEYLAGHLMQNRWFYCFNQDADMLENLTKAFRFDFQPPPFTAEFDATLTALFDSIFLTETSGN